MIAAQRVIDALKQLGLNLYERKLWVALLSRGLSSAGELSSISKVPHSRTYDVLESLAEKGFVMIQATKPIKYVAIEPLEALERAKMKIKEESELAIERIDEFKNTPYIKELQTIFKQGMEFIEPGELTGSIKGDSAFRRQFEYLLKNAKKSFSIITTENGLEMIHSKHGKSLEKAAARGVKIKIAAPVSKKTQPIIEKMKGSAEIKKLPENKILGRMIIADGAHVMFALTNDKEIHASQDLALWTKSEHAASDMFVPMFEHVWKNLEDA